MSKKENTSSSDSSSADPRLQAEVERAIRDFEGAGSQSASSPDTHEYEGWVDVPAPEPGDGTLDEQTVESDRDVYDHYEMGSATFVGVEQLDEEFDENLQRVNEERDRFSGGLSTRQAQWDKKRVTEALCSRLELTEYQQGGIVDAIEALDLNQFGNQGQIETVALGLIRFVVNKDRLERNPNATRISEEGRFQQLLDDCGVEMSDLTTVKRIAVEQLPNLSGGGSVPRRDPNLPDTPPEDQPDEWWDRHFDARYGDLSEKEWKQVPPESIESIPERFEDDIPDQYLSS